MVCRAFKVLKHNLKLYRTEGKSLFIKDFIFYWYCKSNWKTDNLKNTVESSKYIITHLYISVNVDYETLYRKRNLKEKLNILRWYQLLLQFIIKNHVALLQMAQIN